MDKRILDLSGMQNKADNRTADRNNDSCPIRIPPCINADYCVNSPKDMNNGVLTMAFVDMQPLESIYPLDTGFCSGTLFPNINKPFYGGRKND